MGGCELFLFLVGFGGFWDFVLLIVGLHVLDLI